MSLTVGTHSGTFHADDVLAFSLIRTFLDGDAEVVRTRDLDTLDGCDIVIDVGGVYDPSTRRFDHHQGSYRGPRSSAGMILDWLESSGQVSADLASYLRDRVVEYIDAVDTGREAPRLDVPCFARIVEAVGLGAETPDQQRAAFLEASDIGMRLLQGLLAGHARIMDAREHVAERMDDAVREGRSVILLDRYVPWKQAYFDLGGETHPTDYVLFPSEDGSWKLVAIPPTIGQFEQKRPLPASWAGKMNEELEAATGIPGSVFCHKNRFIAVFTTREGALEALRRFDLFDARPRHDEAASPAGE